MTGPTLNLRDAVDGRVDHWRWQPGLDPTTVAASLDTAVAPGEILHAGHLRQAATIRLPERQWPLWALWDPSGELVLIEVPEPSQAPTAAEALASYGAPDARIDRTRGPYPGNEQLAYLSRGFTLFLWGTARPAYLWLYRPTDLDAYVADLGATTNPTRPRR